MDTNNPRPIFNIRQKDWYYLVAQHEGKRVLLGPYPTEDRANEIGFEKQLEDFQVFKLPTKDRGAATGMMKAKLFEGDNTLTDSLQKMRHKL